MNPEPYQKTLDDLTFAQDTMQRQLQLASPYEAILILQLQKQLAETKHFVQSMLDASQYADSLINQR